MTPEINAILILIEATIINEENPDYLEVSYQVGFLYVLVSRKDYKGMPLIDRINRIMAFLKFDHEDILDQYPIIIEALDSDELTDLLKMYAE